MPDSMPDAMLARYLAERDVPCPVCSYNLRGLTAERCPECGATLCLQIKGNDSLNSGWLIGAFGWSGLGFLSLWVMGAVLLHGELGEQPIAIAVIVLFTLSSCTVGVKILKRPAWFFRMRVWRRWIIVLVPFALLLVVQALTLWFSF